MLPLLTACRNFTSTIMHIITALLVALMLACSSSAFAQNITYPGKPPLRQYTNSNLGMQVGFPADWKLDRPLKNEIWLAVGTLRGHGAACFVRLSAVEGLRLSEPETYFAQASERDFVKLNSIAMPDIRMHLFDMAYLGGRKARRAVYSGTDSGVKTGTVTYQTLDGHRIVTLGCVSEASTFQLLYNDFEAVAASFRFVARSR